MPECLRVGLWDRLGEPKESALGEQTSDGQLIKSICRHLSRLLNTRRGDSPASPDYGLPDLAGVILGLPVSEKTFCRAIEETIRKHEPRLTEVRVSVEPGQALGSTHIEFLIEARLAHAEEDRRHRLSCRVDTESMISVN